jgi:phosphomannomutase / phosphoglucomutase
MVTGSHNPPDYNGLKMVLGSDTLSTEAIKKLYARIENESFYDGQGIEKNMILQMIILKRSKIISI